jgi:peptidoglycan/LPS O-acetylase OafA/YrhL
LDGARGEVNYVLLPTRIDTLAVGALLACAARSPDLLAKIQNWGSFVVGTSLAALFIIVLVEHTLDFQQPLTQLLGYSAIAMISAWMVLYAIGSRGWLTARPLKFIGKYSYAMYIWHGVVIALIAKTSRIGGLTTTWSASMVHYLLFVTVVILATIGTALLSWSLVEGPFLRMKKIVPYA